MSTLLIVLFCLHLVQIGIYLSVLLKEKSYPRTVIHGISHDIIGLSLTILFSIWIGIYIF